ncbi:unnamed protein product [Amoebophrya sp. A120]|nr:unnamed protein product [Amoebophrya sp. A120]|eukprot:GSA120T00003229001.1
MAPWLAAWVTGSLNQLRDSYWPQFAAQPSSDAVRRSADGEDTGDAAKVQCKSSLIPGGKYTTYDNSELVCRHGNYMSSIDLELKAPNWSAYYITPDESLDEKGGRRKFKADPAVPEEKQEPLRSKCWGQKWNRGHLCPSYIMSYNKDPNGPWDDTYFITNTAMQYGPFNQQTWQHLEKHTVEWISKNKKPIYIVTGTFFKRDALTKCNLDTGDITGPSSSSSSGVVSSDAKKSETSGPMDEGRYMGVPDFYYKIMCDPSAKKSIAHIGHNRADDKVKEMSVGDLHKMIGLELFPEEGCGTAEMDSDYWWTESLGKLQFLEDQNINAKAVQNQKQELEENKKSAVASSVPLLAQGKRENGTPTSPRTSSSSTKPTADDSDATLYNF